MKVFTCFGGPSRDAADHFVRDGYVVYRGIHDPTTIGAWRLWIRSRLWVRSELARRQAGDLHAATVEVMDEFQKTPLYDEIVSAPSLLVLLKQYLGPDICLLGFDALWVNASKDKNPVLLKGIHQDAWTGTSVNTIFVKTFFTDCDQYNGITVYPGSHLQGMLPVRNRGVDPAAKVKFKGVNLKDIKAGDVLIWHPLLLHSTTGHSAKNIRISMTSRYTSTETAFSSQERALGYRTLSVGPMNQILRLIGNDSLTPLRTYGGVVAIDRRMKGLYGS